MPRVDPRRVRVLQERADGARPRARGRVHQAAAVLTPIAGVPLVAGAAPGDARLGAGVFVASLFTLFATSAAYHRIAWSPTWALRMKRADHVAIFVAVAGTYTPVALVVLDGGLRTTVLAVSWGAVVLAVGASALGLFEVRGVAITAYIALGWMALLIAPQAIDALSTLTLVLIVAGGVVYTAGAVGLATRWPDPDPERFGFHEVWHVNTVIAAALHFAAIALVVTP